MRRTVTPDARLTSGTSTAALGLEDLLLDWGILVHNDVIVDPEPANLAECHLPLFDLIQSQLEPWRQATAAADGA